MNDPERLRAQAVRLLALALEAHDTDPDYADELVAEAIELEDQATKIENAAKATEA